MQEQHIQNLKVQKSEKPKFQVTLIIDDGQKIATYSSSQSTAFAALSEVAKQNKIEIVTKQYDFGVFVQKIAGLESGKDQAGYSR